MIQARTRNRAAVLCILLLSSVMTASAFEAPSINAPSTLNGVVGQPLSLNVDAGGNPAPVVVALNLPAGLSLTAGVLGGTPTQPGQSAVTVLATNILGTDLKVLTLNVTSPLGVLPSITSSLSENGTVGTAYNYVIGATGTAPLTYAADNLPAGLTLVGDTISGIPTLAGEFDIPLTVSNAVGAAQKILHLSLSAAGVMPNITGNLNAIGTVGVPLDLTVTATGTTPLTYAITNLPAGLQATGNRITGIPTQTGLFPINVSVSNPLGSDQDVVSLSVGANSKPSITSALTASGTVGVAFTYTITATGAGPITYGVANLPNGLTLQGAVISGSPTVSGAFNVTLAAINSAGSDVKTLALTVAAGNGGPGNPGVPNDTDGDGIPNNIDTDDDNDGFPDEMEEVAGSDPLDPNSTPIGGSAANPPQDLNVRKLSIKLNFARSQSDAIQVQGSLAVPPNFTLNTQRVIVDVGGVARLFTLNAQGLAKTGADSFHLKVSKSKRVKNSQNGKFSARLMGGDWQTKLSTYGLTNATVVKQEKMIPVMFLFNGTMFTKTQIQFYTAKQGRSGRTK